MPKEWNEYAVYFEYSGCGGKCTAVSFLLPTNEMGSGYDMQNNGRKYFSMMKINAWMPPSFDEVSNSPECKEGPCPSIKSILGRNSDYVFTIDGSQDMPSDLQKEPYMVGLNFPENFNKYFKFELVSE